MKPKPTPWRGDSDAPPELASALKALREGHDDAARVARVGERLGPLLDAPLAAPSVAGWLKVASNAPLFKLGVVALVSAGFAAGWLDGAQAPAAEPARSRPTAVAVEMPIASDQLQRARRDTDVPEAALRALTPSAAPAVDDTAAGAASLSPPSPAVARPARQLRRRSGLAHLPQRRESGFAVGASQPPAMAQPTQSAQRKASRALAAVEPLEAAFEAPAEAAAPPARPLTEVQLLIAARRELATDPTAALRKVEEHMARFLGGTLAPEREVLAIRALQALGRDQAAARRLKQFRARYPGSAHLRADF